MKMKENGKKKEYLLAALSVILAVVLDQFTKHLAVVNLKDNPSVKLIPGVFEPQYLENRGAAFGIMQNQQLFFIISTVVIMAVILFIYSRIPADKKYYPMKICIVLVCAGAVGNLIDRIINNYVVDFFYFSLIDFPIFNVADCYVVIACFLFAFLILFYYKDEDLKFISFNKEKE